MCENLEATIQVVFLWHVAVNALKYICDLNDTKYTIHTYLIH